MKRTTILRFPPIPAIGRPLPWLLFPYMLGIVGGSHFFVPSSYLWVGIIGGSACLALFLRTGKKEIGLLVTPLVFFLIGFLYIQWILFPDLPPNHILRLPEDHRYRLEGVLYRPPEPLPDKTRLYIRIDRAIDEKGDFPVQGHFLLTVRDTQNRLAYGDRVRFLSKIYRPRPATNPGGFDYRRYLALQGIWATGQVNHFNEIVRLAEGQGNPFFHFVEKGRQRIRDFLDETAPASSRGIIKALIIGERGDIPKEVNEKFIRAGVNHILCISGLHVALVAGFFFAAARAFLKSFPSLLLRFSLNRMAALTAIVPVIFYTFIAGLGIAAVRSAIMVLCFLWMLLLEREKDLYDALGFAAFAILGISPAALFDISFQLSFLSVLGIVYLVPRFQEYLALFRKKDSGIPSLEGRSPWRKKIIAYGELSILTSLAAILATGPLVSTYFNRISVIGVLSNLLLVPLMGLGGTLLSLLSAFGLFLIPAFAEQVMILNGWLMEMALFCVSFFSQIPQAQFRMSTPTIPEVLILYGLLLFGANLKRWRGALWGVGALAAVWAVLQVYDLYTERTNPELTVTFLDVGQADAAVIHFPGGKTMVIDGGGTPDGNFDPGERIVAPYLWKKKRKSIDIMVNSHSHPDHVQGLLYLLEHFSVGEVWSNGIVGADSMWGEKFVDQAGERLIVMGREERPREINGVRIEFLHPPQSPQREIFGKENDDSLVIRLVYGNVSFLFPGDIEAAAEEDLVKSGLPLRSTVIKAPHHGSRSSSTPSFLERVRPQYVLFPVRGGKSGLPNPKVIERYESLGAKVYRSDRDGAVTFTTDGKNLKVETFLKASGVNRTPAGGRTFLGPSP